MRHTPLWFAGISLLTLIAAVNCSPDDYRSESSKTCENNKLDKEKGETDVDCGGEFCKRCIEFESCVKNADCSEGLLCDDLTRKCLSTHCTNKTKDGDETDKDCGGSSCPACNAGATCSENKDCDSTVCKSGKCTAASCSDKIQNQGESDIDCGDPNKLCEPCLGGQSCTSNEGCSSRICNQGTCTEPSCDDRIKNGLEGDVDCGGNCKVLCGQGDTCLTDKDCKSGVCNETCVDAKCGDTVQNGDETDVDCGASCGGCLEGKTCKVGSDCKSTFCKDNVCVIPTCTDGIQNQGESDVDCGSPVTTCAPCSGGKVCATATDCESGICTENRCVASSCNDLKLNGNEGDVDCGGSCPVRCADNQKCREMSDCASGVCSDSICRAPSCNDATKNGLETDKDCGGPCSAKCEVGRGCNTNSDCKINSCNQGVCGDPSCSNNTTDGTETATDCGGDRCQPCSEGKACELARDCVSQRCVGKLCSASVCGDQVQNGLETDVDCGGDCAKKCSIDDGCAKNSDCESGKCSTGKCQTPACNDVVQNDLETDVDCGGAVCVGLGRPCENGRSCLVDADCRSAVCNASTGKCQAQGCGDKRQNQTETDVDCGGICGATCGVGKKCVDAEGTDCIDGICKSGTCSAAACPDGVKNGGEGDVDCGAVCAKVATLCEVGQTCNNNADCVEGVCGSDGRCSSPSCTDSVQNGSESDIDCGRNCSKKCADGAKCAGTLDCDTVAMPGTVCLLGVCVAKGCSNGLLDDEKISKTGTETDIDCGGLQCKACAVHKNCLIPSDCDPITSGNCFGSGSLRVCVAATCSDSILNGAETDIDCGGSDAACDPCADGKICIRGSDCASQICDANKCLAPTCADKIMNGSETALDCGGATCDALGNKCEKGEACSIDKDCVSGWCKSKVCTARSCTDTVQNGSESDVDCGEICSTSKCAVGKKCVTDADCAYPGTCSECTGLCVNPSSSCYRPNSSSCSFCASGQSCSKDDDCTSFTCTGGTCAPADNCAGQLLTDANGQFADGTKICNISNPSDVFWCQTYLRCFFINSCNPSTACASNDGICGVNKIGGGSTGSDAAKASWRKANCTEASSVASGL